MPRNSIVSRRQDTVENGALPASKGTPGRRARAMISHWQVCRRLTQIPFVPRFLQPEGRTHGDNQIVTLGWEVRSELPVGNPLVRSESGVRRLPREEKVMRVDPLAEECPGTFHGMVPGPDLRRRVTQVGRQVVAQAALLEDQMVRTEEAAVDCRMVDQYLTRRKGLAAGEAVEHRRRRPRHLVVVAEVPQSTVMAGSEYRVCQIWMACLRGSTREPER